MSKLITAKSALLLPGLGSPLIRPMPRAIVGRGVRADAANVSALIESLTKATAEMRAEIDGAKKEDVVHAEKVDRINADIGKMQAAVEELVKVKAAVEDMAVQLAAFKAHGDKVLGDMPASTPAQISAFKTFMRAGDIGMPAEVYAALSKTTDAEGGYFAPVEWDRTIVNKLKQISKIRENARVISISVAGFRKLYNDRAVGSGWVGETAARPATTTPAIGTLDFSPGELYANPAISMQLLQDAAVNLEDWLASEVETEFARQEGIAFLSGDGVNKPFGILTYVTGAANAAKHPWGAIVVTNTGAAAALTGDGFIDLMYGLPSEFAGNAKLYMNRGSMGAVRKLKDGQGNYLWQPTYVAGQPQTVNGSPVVEVPGMPAVGAGNIAALYGDMDQTYLVVDRIGISVLRDPYTNKPFVHFYTTKRVGGGVYNPEPMRALKVSA